MPLDEALQARAEGYPHRPHGDAQRPQVAVEGPESAVGQTARPGWGHFVSAQHEADCARFLSETKKIAQRRAEAALGHPSAVW